ncbi:MAG: hypothetical protein MEQ84_08045 [Mesorhizobium sp.]|nr:hypothetical protein [Mesorhizobium sp.]
MLDQMTTGAAIAGFIFLGACTSTVGQLQEMGDRNYMRYAVGKPYQEVASLNPMTFESLTTGGNTAYGPIIGAYRLENGDRVYRHAANIQSSESTVDVGIIMQRSEVETRHRLAYFRVGADGIVSDWATGTLPGERISCTAYAAGIFQRCSSEMEIRQSMTVYDSLVQTSGGQPLSSWGANVGEIEPGSAAMVSTN